MFTSAIVILLSSGAVACPESVDHTDHLSDACGGYHGSEPAYSATWSASLSPKPSEQQVMVFRHEGKWMIRIAGFQWTPGSSLVEHRRNELTISDEDAAAIIALMGDEKIEQLDAEPYYGSNNRICLDGARYELAAARDGLKRSASRHSCAAKNELNQIMGEFRSLALKYDPTFEGMLAGLSGAANAG